MDGGIRLLAEVCVYGRRIALLRFGVANAGSDVRRIHTLALVHQGRVGAALLRPPAKRWRWFRHGWQSWTPSLSIGVGQRNIEVHPPVHAPIRPGQKRGELASEEVGVLFDTEASRSLLVGFVSARQQWTQVQVDASKRALRAIAVADGVPLLPGETMWSERLLIEFSDEPEPALQRYAEAMAREMGARMPESIPTGWCSWYYYFTTVTEADILRNLRFLEQHRREVPVELVQIDDGYQAGIGDWTTANDKFPSGMSSLARDIKDAGFTPGIWLAPFLAGERSRVFAEHPDWVIRGDKDEPALAMENWNQRNFGLDCSNSEVTQWMETLFREVTGSWGYEYVKVDFLYGAAIPGKRRDPGSTRIDSYRRGMMAIRDGVGSSRFILGCGALMGSSVGIVDAQRIGPDVAPWWQYRPRGTPARRGRQRIGGEPATENAVRNILTRSWMNGRLWTNDPDCLLARQARTKLTLPEVRSLATAIALSGGAVLLSDDFRQLSDDRLDLIASILPPVTDPVAVPGLLGESMPSTMSLAMDRPFDSWLVVARFNWAGRPRDLDVPLPSGRWHVFEFWGQRYLGVHEGRLDVNAVPPHGVCLLSLRRVLDRPQVIGTSFHVSMGGKELADVEWNGTERLLRLSLQPVAKQSGQITLYLPQSMQASTAHLSGVDANVRSIAANVINIGTVIDNPCELRALFA
jgi:alpha-galactosidase